MIYRVADAPKARGPIVRSHGADLTLFISISLFIHSRWPLMLMITCTELNSNGIVLKTGASGLIAYRLIKVNI